MTTPNRGRGRGYSRGRGRSYGSNNMLPHQEMTVPLIGDVTVFYNRARNVQQLPAPPKKEDIPSSSSSSKTMSYKDTMVNEPPQDKEYFENPVTEHILYIEDEDIQIAQNDGWSLRTRYLESRGYPGLHGKARPSLETLLTITESVTITHHYQNNNPESFINFSKCHINKILLPREWGLNPNGDKAIRIAEGKYIYFNYWDYIQAFSKTFYYQNPKNKHSWFFSINPEILERPVPNWFYSWWSKFGPSTEILPKEIKDLYKPWCDNSILVSNLQSDRLIFGQCPFLFFTKFQIPWIWRWSISISKDKLDIPILRRDFFYKWWNKMSPEDILKITVNIKTVISDEESRGPKDQFQQASMPHMKNYFHKKYPTESEDEIMVRVLDHMKNQFLQTFPTQSSKDDESMKTVSSPGSIEDSNTFNCLAGESQAEATQEDFWDSLIVLLSEKAKNSKGKEPSKD